MIRRPPIHTLIPYTTPFRPLNCATVLAHAVDDTQVDQAHRHLGILNLGQRGPEVIGAHDSWWCALRKLWNSSWNMATISAFLGPRSRQRARTSSQVMGCLKSQRFSPASNSQGNG